MQNRWGYRCPESPQLDSPHESTGFWPGLNPTRHGTKKNSPASPTRKSRPTRYWPTNPYLHIKSSETLTPSQSPSHTPPLPLPPTSTDLRVSPSPFSSSPVATHLASTRVQHTIALFCARRRGRDREPHAAHPHPREVATPPAHPFAVAPPRLLPGAQHPLPPPPPIACLASRPTPRRRPTDDTLEPSSSPDPCPARHHCGGDRRCTPRRRRSYKIQGHGPWAARARA
jgi:hypothetical protein